MESAFLRRVDGSYEVLGFFFIAWFTDFVATKTGSVGRKINKRRRRRFWKCR